MLKVEKAVARELGAGQLAEKHLRSVLAKDAERNARDSAPGRIVQKHREIKGSEARRQMKEDDGEEQRVINMRGKRA